MTSIAMELPIIRFFGPVLSAIRPAVIQPNTSTTLPINDARKDSC
ncbi:hypothetical protein [Arthrobacter sp. NPDC058127]